MRECLWLVKNGIPFDVAFSLSDTHRAAWCIVFSELGGRKFNWTSMAFEEE